MTMNIADMMAPDADADAEAEFITVDTPTTDVPELSCVVCGKGLTYGGRGPKPKYCEEHKKGGANKSLGGGTGRGKSSSADVDAAVATLDQAYDLLELALMFTGAHKSMRLLRASIEGEEDENGRKRKGLRQQNREYLATDREMAKKIASIGKTGGRYAFFASQAATLLPVAVLAMGEISVARAEKRNQAATEDADMSGGTNLFGAPIE